MELPRQYPYNPRVRLILFVFGAGLLWIGIQWLSLGRKPSGFGLWFGLTPIMLAMLLGSRRISGRRYLRLDGNAMVLPTGFFQMKVARVEYSRIVRVWRHYWPATVVLRVATQNQIFDIVSVLLPDNASYRALEEFLKSKAQENASRTWSAPQK